MGGYGTYYLVHAWVAHDGLWIGYKVPVRSMGEIGYKGYDMVEMERIGWVRGCWRCVFRAVLDVLVSRRRGAECGNGAIGLCVLL